MKCLSQQRPSFSFIRLTSLLNNAILLKVPLTIFKRKYMPKITLYYHEPIMTASIVRGFKKELRTLIAPVISVPNAKVVFEPGQIGFVAVPFTDITDFDKKMVIEIETSGDDERKNKLRTPHEPGKKDEIMELKIAISRCTFFPKIKIPEFEVQIRYTNPDNIKK